MAINFVGVFNSPVGAKGVLGNSGFLLKKKKKNERSLLILVYNRLSSKKREKIQVSNCRCI